MVGIMVAMEGFSVLFICLFVLMGPILRGINRLSWLSVPLCCRPGLPSVSGSPLLK